LNKSALLLAATVLAACGRPTSTATVAPSQLAPPDAFQCVMNTMKAIGFQRTMYDEADRRTSGRRENPNISFSSTQFRKTWDRLDVQVLAASDGTQVEVLPVTEAEYFGQNGKNFQPLTPSEDVQAAARKLQRDCGGAPSGPTGAPAADSVPAAAPN
jgi:hypothetical protein